MIFALALANLIIAQLQDQISLQDIINKNYSMKLVTDFYNGADHLYYQVWSLYLFFKWFKYIIPALSPLEQSIMLGGFKQNAPKEVFAATIKRLKPYVSAKQCEYIGSL